MKCLIVDVSSVGYRLLMHESLNLEETIQLQLNGARVFARVQYCQLDEDKFSIGLERVDEWLVAPRIAAQRSFPSNACAHESLRTLGRPKVNYLDRLTTIATRLLFAHSIMHKKHHSHKIARMALAIGAALVIALLALYFYLGPIRLRGDSALSASSTIQRTPQAQSGYDPKTPGNAIRSQGSHQILIKANDKVWVLACSDGQKLFDKLLRSGDTAQFQFSRQALLHSGNAGALEVTIDSRSVGAMGEGTSVRAWRFSPDGYKDVPVALNHTCEIR